MDWKILLVWVNNIYGLCDKNTRDDQQAATTRRVIVWKL